MPVFTAGNTSAGQVAGTAITRLLALRRALADAATFQAWLAAQADADLNGIGMSEADVNMLRPAAADASALSVMYNTGLPPSTYPQPPVAYVYSASQRLIIGAQ